MTCNLKTQKYILTSFIFLWLVGCKSDVSSSEGSVTKVKITRREALKKVKLPVEKRSENQIKAIHSLVNIQTIDPTIRVDLKYATTDNFMHEVLYDTLRKAYLQNDVAKRLSDCQTFLKNLHPEYSLLVYDAMRPRKVQAKMWKALDSLPIGERSKFVSNPANGSVHNYGAAVDITICDKTGVALDMGAGYDDIRKIAYPSLEAKYVQSGELSASQLSNRKLLRKVMRRAGFINIPTEWWHFNAYPRIIVKRKYLIIE